MQHTCLLGACLLSLIALPTASSADNNQPLFTGQGLILAQNEMANDYSPTPASKPEASEDREPTQAEIAEAINNPLSSLWMLFVQNDTKWYSGDALDRLGEDDKTMNTTLIQPVMPMQITEDWKMIFRPVIPINSFETVSGWDVEPASGIPTSLDLDFKRETGLGDIVLWTAFSNTYTPPNIFGFGPTVMLDTASDESLGTGKWSAGPMALAFHVGEKWIYGAVAQQWWSFAGDDDRNNVNLTDIQYVLRYRLTDKTNIGFSPNIQANWDADSDNRYTVPVGIGADTLVKIGKLPVKVGIEAYYSVIQPDDFGSEWQIRLMFVPVIGAPKWSQRPMF